MAICEKDCFNCPHPDCINDAFGLEDRKAHKRIDALLRDQTPRQKKIAAYNAAYYAEHKDEIAAYNAAYYAKPKDATAANQVREYRKERGLTQREFARICGVTHAAVSHWELQRVPVPDFVRAMVGAEKEKSAPGVWGPGDGGPACGPVNQTPVG